MVRVVGGGDFQCTSESTQLFAILKSTLSNINRRVPWYTDKITAKSINVEGVLLFY